MSRTKFFLQPDGKVVSDQIITVRKSELDALIEKANRAEAAEAALKMEWNERKKRFARKLAALAAKEGAK